MKKDTKKSSAIESTKAERTKLTAEKSSTSGGGGGGGGCGGRPSTASSASASGGAGGGGGENSVGGLRSNHSSGKAANDYSVGTRGHSNHSRAGRSSARSSVFDDF